MIHCFAFPELGKVHHRPCFKKFSFGLLLRLLEEPSLVFHSLSTCVALFEVRPSCSNTVATSGCCGPRTLSQITSARFVEHAQIVEDGGNAPGPPVQVLFANSLSAQQKALVIVHHLTDLSGRADAESTEPKVFPEVNGL